MRRGRPKGGPQTAVRRPPVAVRSLPSRRFMVYKQPLRSFGPSLLAGEAYTKGCLCFVIIYH